MVEVFKTNVRQTAQASQLVDLLSHHFPACKINFDLEDCDKILRMEGKDFRAGQVMQLLQAQGFYCGMLE